MQPNVLVSRLIETWKRTPDRCVLSVDGEQVSARELDAAVQKFSARLMSDSGISSGAVVGLCMPRSIEWVVAQLAVLRLGGIVAQMDMAASAERIGHMVGLLKPSLVVVAAEAMPSFAGLAPPCLQFANWRELGEAFGPDAVLEVAADQPSYVMFTSGTTGVPKAVPVPGAGLIRLAQPGSAIALHAGQRWAVLASPGFDAALLELWCPLLNDGVCVLQTVQQPDLRQLADFLVSQQVTDLLLTTSLFNALVEDQLGGFIGVKQVLIGGEQASPSHARALLSEYPGIRLVNAYGPTENAVVSLCHRVCVADLDDPDGIPIGTPMPGDEVCLDGDPVSGGGEHLEGELWVSGAGVGHGYLGAPDASAARFTVRDGQRWYRTGDRVRLGVDGAFRYLGRIDRQVKIRGHRIELDEVELHLSRAPGVSEAVVHLEGDSAETRHLVAVVAGSDMHACLDVSLVRAHLLRHLPPAAVPSRLLKVARLPRSLSGKIDRLAARRLSAAPPTDQSFRSALAASLQRHGDRIALIDGQSRLTYADMELASARWASAFEQAGIRRGDVIPLHGPRSADMVLAMLGLLRLGAAFAPIDLQSPPERVRAVLEVLRPPMLLADASTTQHFPGWQQCCPVHSIEAWRAQLPEASSSAWASDAPELPLYVMFTSGSTGVPKGVVVSNANLGALLVSPHWADFSADARWLWATSPAFDIAMVEIWGALLHGAELVILQGCLPALSELVGLIHAHRVTHVQLATALFNALVDVDVGSLRHVRQFITGGERASPSHMRRALLACPDLALINGYGPTEATVYATARHVCLADTWEPEGVPIGQPLPGVKIKVDPESGELWLGGAGVALGYHRAPQLTQERFIAEGGERWYRTGDLVRVRPDGVLTYHGRADRQIKLQGQRFELDEVELTISSVAHVLDAVVFVRGGDSSRQLVACVRTAPGHGVDEVVLSRWVAQRLPDVAVPKTWLFFEQFPVTANGKVDRRTLEQTLESARAGEARESRGDAPVTWANATEAVLAEIWRELLPHAAIARGSHFVKAGGTSILALRVAAQVEIRLRKALRPVDVLLHPVLSDQARWIDHLPAMTDADAGVDGVVPVSRWHLTQAQQALLNASSLDETGSAYLVHVALRWPEPSDRLTLKQALEWLAERHPVLGLRVHAQAGMWRADLTQEMGHGWWREHADVLSAVPRDLEAWDLQVLDVIQRPLDLGECGVWRVDLWSVADGGWLSVLTLHHAVVDEESVDLLLSDLSAYFQGAVAHPGSVDSAQLTAIERGLRVELTTATLTHIKERLRGCTPPLGRVPAAGRERLLHLPPDWRSADSGLLARAQQSGRSPFAVFMACHVRAVQAVFGMACGHVSTPFSRRAMAELQGVVTYWVDVPVLDLGQRVGESVAAHLVRVERALIAQQALKFAPVHDLAAALSLEDSDAAVMLTQFGMTWRQDPERTLRMGPCQVDLVRVPQRASRFGLCLHMARVGDALQATVEGVEEVFSGGWFDAYARAFLRCLKDVEPVLLMPTKATTTQTLVVPAGVSESRLRELWGRWLDCTPAQLEAESNFFALGGTSLKAMRMAADLQGISGCVADLPAFLANPTFAGWVASVRPWGPPPAGEDRAPHADILVGPADASRVVFLIPGLGGHALGLVGIAQALVKQDPDCRVVIPDLDEVLCGVPSDDLLPALLSELSERLSLCMASGGSVALAGFSLGGLLALLLSEQWRSGASPMRPPVFLIDTYAGRMASQSLWRLVERKLARLRAHFARREKVLPAAQPLVDPQAEMPVRTERRIWAKLESELAALPDLARQFSAHVALIKAQRSEEAAEIWWRRGTNGLNPAQFATFRVEALDAWHLDLARDKAAETAAKITAIWRSIRPD
jgi:amino acid adenylation domain-containing protein